MFAVTVTSVAHICCGNYAAANAQLDELFAVADEKGALFWKAYGMVHQGWRFALTRNASERGRHDHLRNYCISVDGSNIFCAVASIVFG